MPGVPTQRVAEEAAKVAAQATSTKSGENLLDVFHSADLSPNSGMNFLGHFVGGEIVLLSNHAAEMMVYRIMESSPK